MPRRPALPIIALALAACGGGPATDGYDVVILNGRVMDPETEFDSVSQRRHHATG